MKEEEDDDDNDNDAACKNETPLRDGYGMLAMAC